MYRTSINKLKDYLRESSATLGSPDFMLLLGISAPHNSSADRVFARILKLALNEFEKLNPLYLYGVLPNTDDQVFIFQENFGDYLAGTLDESYIQLVPTSIISLSGSWVYQYRDYVYSAPCLSLTGYPYNNEIYYATRRPVLLTFDPSGKDITDDSYLYCLDIDGGAVDRWFLRYLEYEVLIYLRDQKNNISYPDMPIDFLSGLPERIAEVYQILETYRQSPVKNAELLR